MYIIIINDNNVCRAMQHADHCDHNRIFIKFDVMADRDPTVIQRIRSKQVRYAGAGPDGLSTLSNIDR